jgi:predicted aspartyl protease
MRSFRFDPHGKAPIISALISGPHGTRKVRLIFDTGAEMTQIHTARVREVGHSPSTAVAKASVVGVGGVEAEGYVVNLEKLFVLGCKAENLHVEVFDMQYLSSKRLDGLLGWDVIKAFHLEMDGPNGLLKIF